jgi:hypothetical protein
VRGIKGPRADQLSAIWIYESREAWEALWGTVDRPKRKQEYPSKCAFFNEAFGGSETYSAAAASDEGNLSVEL